MSQVHLAHLYDRARPSMAPVTLFCVTGGDRPFFLCEKGVVTLECQDWSFVWIGEVMTFLATLFYAICACCHMIDQRKGSFMAWIKARSQPGSLQFEGQVRRTFKPFDHALRMAYTMCYGAHVLQSIQQLAERDCMRAWLTTHNLRAVCVVARRTCRLL